MRRIRPPRCLMRCSGIFLCLVLAGGLGAGAERVHAAETPMDPEVKKRANAVMLRIFKDIYAQRNKYKELAHFDESALFENRYGIYTIVYQFGEDNPNETDKRKTPYAFGLTIDPLEETTFDPRPGSFYFSFPLLGVKFSGYQKRHLLRTQFRLLPLVKKHGVILSNYQQSKLPLRITVRPLKEKFSVREDIAFEVILKNVSKRHMIVKDLNKNSLSFEIDGQVWGAVLQSGGKGHANKILKSGEELHAVFRGESFARPRSIAISATYAMSIDGINPFDRANITIVDEELPPPPKPPEEEQPTFFPVPVGNSIEIR